MNRDVAQTAVLPLVVLVHAHANQVRHDIGEAVIVVAFHPHDFNAALRIRQLSNIAEEFPVVLGETREIEISEDVAQQDQPLETSLVEHAGGLPRVAGFRPKVQV